MKAADLHERVESAFNAGDVDALVSLYEPNAQMVDPDGSIVVGRDNIRGIWAGFVSLGGRITMTTRYAIENGEIALLSNHWEWVLDDERASSDTADVARRQGDGTWLYVVDNPHAAPTVVQPGTDG